MFKWLGKCFEVSWSVCICRYLLDDICSYFLIFVGISNFVDICLSLIILFVDIIYIFVEICFFVEIC